MAAAKLLYRRLDSLFGGLKSRRSQPKLVEAFLEDCFQTLREDLRLRGAALYAERRDGFALVKTVGEPGSPVAEALDPQHSPLVEVVRHRVYIFGDPGAPNSPQHLQLLGPAAASAGLIVGERPLRYVLFFLLADGWQPEELDFALNTVRAALGARMVDARVRGSFREAAEIQQSLLVEEPPEFHGFELAARSVAAEEVGGDFYDFQQLGETTLGVSIGDASGHGLPAALLVRDVVTGLRMGIQEELKIAHVFEKLNRVIHQSRLSSRFVSVFYGEVEDDGNIVYVNAGHQPPILFFKDLRPEMPCDLELAAGGTVIGPLPQPRFRRGFARLRPGEVLVMCTDGILERRDKSGTFFGADGLRSVVRQRQTASAQAILDAVFDASWKWGEARPWEDDATALVLKRP
ncbi:MAG TPA: PP2C family protein-serine/threonine phosphatase [Vicinamibacteria bacterium]|nr:PP2C family protein-serine/threonine phosphatase [Vicinamibacteria bacterium]